MMMTEAFLEGRRDKANSCQCCGCMNPYDGDTDEFEEWNEGYYSGHYQEYDNDEFGGYDD